VWATVWNGSAWSNASLGGEPAASGTSPTVVRDPGSGDQWVYYVGGDGKVWATVWNGARWSNASLGGEPAASGTSPTVVRPAPSVESTPIPTPLPRPTARHALHVKVVLTWTWSYRVTRLYKTWIGSFPGHMRLTLRCLGRGCPRVAMASAVGARRVRRMLRDWEGRRFRAGDRLLVTLTAPGYLPERAAVLIRFGQKPHVRLV
jgi:hypothetical protein